MPIQKTRFIGKTQIAPPPTVRPTPVVVRIWPDMSGGSIALKPYLNCIRTTLHAAMCLENFGCQHVERYNKPEVEAWSVLREESSLCAPLSWVSCLCTGNVYASDFCARTCMLARLQRGEPDNTDDQGSVAQSSGHQQKRSGALFN